MTAPSSENGFSLVEVIVALGILATTAVSLSTLTRGSLQGVKQVEDRYLARIVADGLLANAFTQSAPLRLGTLRGETEQLGRTLYWVQTIAETEQVDLLSIDVQILDAPEGRVLLQTSTLSGGDV